MTDINNPRKYSREWYNTSFSLDDTRYYGLFLKGKDHRVQIDPKRFKNFSKITNDMKKVMDKRNGKFFHPGRPSIHDYNINFMLSHFYSIKNEWEKTNLPIIHQAVGKFEPLKKTTLNPSESDLFQSGIIDYEEAQERSLLQTVTLNRLAAYQQKLLFNTLYAQNFHQLASQIDALLLKTLTRNGYEGDSFKRNVLYAFKGNKEKNVKELDGFMEYDQMYAIWNFIKHNSLSTYKTLKKKYPDVVIDDDYSQGELGCHFIHFSENLINTVLDGNQRFIINYCQLVFDEDPEEAKWNSDQYFKQEVGFHINEYIDPLGLSNPFPF